MGEVDEAHRSTSILSDCMMRFEIRVSHHDPDVVQTATSSWTSIDDVGRSFDDGVLELVEYERVEQLYLDALAGLLRDAGEPRLSVSRVHFSPCASDEARSIREGDEVSARRALEICRWQLREEVECRLNSERVSVAFGFDFYMYVAGADLQPSAVARVQESGLFVEFDFPSPYSNT